MTSINPPELFHSTPDDPPGRLRDLLEAAVEAAPPGSEIDWCTYYFCDARLADALLRARRRGVRVRLALEGAPRTGRVNQRDLERLTAPEGLGADCRPLRPPPAIPGLVAPARLHAKIYGFSHPRPQVFIGSFNPSGDVASDPELVQAIGDQDRGFNFLVRLEEPRLVQALLAQARRIWRRGDKPLQRLSLEVNRPVEENGTRLFFYPRLFNRQLPRLLGRLGAGDQARIAGSHIKDPVLLKALCRSARRGAQIQVITHDTERRAPDAALAFLAQAGIKVLRYRHPEGLPMHYKFVLIQGPAGARVAFGSLNMNRRARLWNHELLAISENPDLVEAFGSCWEALCRSPFLAAREGPAG